MLLLCLLYITVAIPLTSISQNRLQKIGTIALIQTLVIVWESTVDIFNSNSFSLTGSDGITLYNGYVIHTNLTNTIDFVLIFVGAILTYSFCSSYFTPWTTKSDLGRNLSNFTSENKEILIFIFCTLLGSMVIINSGDLFLFLLGIELQSYSLYIIATSSGKIPKEKENRNVLSNWTDSEPAEAAGLKYYLLGALASCFILLGIGLIYTITGTTQISSLNFLAHLDLYSSSIEADKSNQILVNIGIGFIGIGLAWKFASAPLHSWAIDVYDAVPTLFATWLAIIPKIALLAFTTQFISIFMNEVSDSNTILSLFLFFSVLSMTIGAIGALTQPLVKRVLAYSSVSQIGFILLGGAVLGPDAALFYLIQYTIVNTGLWLCLLSAPLFSFSKNPGQSEFRTVNDLQGLHIDNYFLAIAFALLFFSTAGIPPMIGFFAKFEVISASLNSGFLGVSLIAITAGLISATYYIRIVKTIWFTKELRTTKNISLQENNQNATILSLIAFWLSLIVLASTFFVLQGKVVLTWCRLFILVS